jgi:hypothetical protein
MLEKALDKEKKGTLMSDVETDIDGKGRPRRSAKKMPK